MNRKSAESQRVNDRVGASVLKLTIRDLRKVLFSGIALLLSATIAVLLLMDSVGGVIDGSVKWMWMAWFLSSIVLLCFALVKSRGHDEDEFDWLGWALIVHLCLVTTVGMSVVFFGVDGALK